MKKVTSRLHMCYIVNQAHVSQKTGHGMENNAVDDARLMRLGNEFTEYPNNWIKMQ
jgi:hypothetical protein